MTDIQLSPHFKLSEFTRSATASARGIPNVPNEEQVANLNALCENVLEPLRQWYGKPIVIGSGFRCPALNKAVGGVSNSQHMKGEAADLGSASSPTAIKELRRWMEFIIDETDFDQCILEHTKSGVYWIHVSCKADRSKNRHHVISSLLKGS